jgi:hypothetical protein
MTIDQPELHEDWGQIRWATPQPVFPGGLIYAKLIEAARLMEGVEKGGYNSAQKFKFRGIEQLTSACAPIFKEVGIVVVPEMRLIERAQQPDKGYRAVVEASYHFYAEDGSFVTATTIGEGVDSYDKATNKAMSAAFKYALLQTLCIGDPDDDSDAHGEPKPARAKAKPAERNEVSAKDWASWEALRARLLADEELKGQFAEWVSAQDFKPERSVSASNFEKLTGMALLLLGDDDEGAPFE